MLANDQVEIIIPLPGLFYGKKRAILISHVIRIGGYLIIRPHMGFFNGSETTLTAENRFIPITEDDKAVFSEYELQDIVAMKDRAVNVTGNVVPWKITDPNNIEQEIDNPDVYSDEFSYFKNLPLSTFFSSITGVTFGSSQDTAIAYNLLDLWNRGKILKK